MSGRARRWAGTVVVALVVSAGCVVAGVWQWNRHEQRSQAVAVVEANHDAEPVPLAQLLDPDAVPDDDVLWRPVRATGRYVGEPVLLRNRPVAGGQAFHVLGVLEVTDGALAGSRLVVDRGWLRPGDDGSVPVPPSAPGGEVDVVVRVRAGEPASDRAAPAGQVQAVHPGQVAVAAGADDGALMAAYGMRATPEVPVDGQGDAGQGTEGLGAYPRPDTDLGSHLSYTFQWWLFAIGALVGAAVLIRRDLRADEDAVPPPPGEPARVPGGVRRRRRPTREEEEDALLDRQMTR